MVKLEVCPDEVRTRPGPQDIAVTRGGDILSTHRKDRSTDLENTKMQPLSDYMYIHTDGHPLICVVHLLVLLVTINNDDKTTKVVGYSNQSIE